MNEDVVYTALCLWERALEMRGEIPAQSTFDYIGYCQVRSHIIELAEFCWKDFEKIREDYDDSFDWEFVPKWMSENLTWTHWSVNYTPASPAPDFFHLGEGAEACVSK